MKRRRRRKEGENMKRGDQTMGRNIVHFLQVIVFIHHSPQIALAPWAASYSY
jgi:hypothetical protein